MRKIEVIISRSGESRVEAFGYHGNSCQTATKAIERALGAKSSASLKPEFYETNNNVNQQKENL
jgi:hypothetical protein